jgi:hypothetical protein
MTITKNVWKAAAFLLILCLVSTVMISGTYAKYTSTYAGQDTALVAKWSVNGIGDFATVSDGSATLDLFDHAYDTNIVTGAGVNYIAPGVAGDFTLQFANNSDVAAQITFAIAQATGSANVPIQYSLTPFTTIDDTGDDLAGIQSDLNDTFATIAPGETKSQIVYWHWKFNGNSVEDTNLGKASAADVSCHTNYGLTVTATAEQLSPATGIE